MSRPPRAASRRLALALLFPALAGCGPSGPAPVAFDPDTVPDAYARSTAALMWPGATRAFQITPAGDLTNGEWVVRLRPSGDGADAPAPRVIAFESRWLPIAHWRRSVGQVRWDFEAFALPEPAPRDSGLLVSLEARATNLSTAPHEARIDAELAAPGPDVVFDAYDAPDRPGPWRWAAGTANDTVCAWSDHAGGGSALSQSWTLAPGQSRALHLVLPAYPTPAGSLARWARRPYSARAADARRHWSEEAGRGAVFALGDSTLEDALRAARVLLLSCRERRGPRWVPIGGPFQYRDVWLRDGARLIQALSVTGYTREARELARGLLEFQWPHGAFLSQRGQLDGTGQALWAFEQALLRPAPADSLERIADAVTRAWGWCERQRAVGRGSNWTFGPMLPFGDPHDAELRRAQLVGNDAWSIAGYRSTERLLRAVHRDAEADSVHAARERYLDDFARALELTHASDIPPSWQGIGRDWGNLSVVWPCAALPPASPRQAALARRIWSVTGGPGLGFYGSADSLHTYDAADLAHWALLAGRRAEADSMLDAMVRWRSASGGAAEIFSRSSRDFGRNLPPHPTAAAALVALARDMLVFDDDDTLRLTLGARAAWWQGGRLSGAPTRWGTCDLRFRRAGAAAEWSWSAVPVWTALTLPPGTRLAGTLPAPLTPGPGVDVVLAPPGTKSARVELADDARGSR